jgi:XTP/dITP diphosphohydrolase
MAEQIFDNNSLFSGLDRVGGKELIIASNNQGKITELRAMLRNIALLSLKDIGFEKEIAEPFYTFEENALAKANAIYKFSGKNVFADDSGLCVKALNDAPGVISAHYSELRDDEQNLQKVLTGLGNGEDRRAFYKAVICLVWEDNTYYFEGICEGQITKDKRGAGGFGYDPIFMPDGYDQTFGELSLDVKNNISHRGIAIRKMVAFLAGA